MSAEIYLRRQAQAADARQAEPAALLVDEKGAAKLLGGLCVKSLYHLRRRGLPFVRIGTRVMYRPADLARWVDAQADAQAGEGVNHE